jgi:membrane protease YdiL (CAAX protease family)
MTGSADAAGRHAWLSPAGALTVLAGVLLAANLLVHRVVPGAPVAVAAGLVLALALLARAAGLTTAELGLARASWGRGLRWGAAAAAVVLAGGGLVLAVPALRDRLAGGGDDWAGVAVQVLLFVPLVTAVPEELAFRGVAWALLRASAGERVATVASSAAFGLWHVLPALGGGPANATLAGVLGPGAVAARVAGTVLVTFLAGLVLCRLRVASGSLLAPIILHWVLNSVGVVLVQLATLW